MKQNVLQRIFALLICVSIMAMGMAGAAETTEKELRIAITDSMTSLEVTAGKDAGILLEQAMMIETLVKLDSEFNIHPNLATEWERTGDITWAIKLREGVTFHDGSAFNAEAVKWDFDKIHENSDSFENTTKIAAVDVIDEYTIQITTSVPTTDLPQNLTHKMCAIIAPSSYDADGNFVKPIGTGYFQFESFDVNASRLTVVPYEGYWGEKPDSSIARRVITSIPDASTRALAASNGEVDIACDVPFSDLVALQDDPNLNVLKYNTARNYQIAFNQMNDSKAYLQDVNVRHALLHAIDRQTIVDTLLFGVGGVPNGIFMDSVPWNNTEVDTYEYDPELAMQMLDEAGFVDSDNDGIREYNGEEAKIVIICSPGRPGAPLIAQAMQGYFAAIGLDAETQVLEGNTMSEVRESGEFDIAFNSVATCNIPTPSYYLTAAYYTGSYTAKNVGYSNPELDAAIDAIVAAQDEEEKIELSKAAQKMAQDDAVIMTIELYGAVFITNAKLTGFDYSPAVHDFIVPITTDIAD